MQAKFWFHLGGSQASCYHPKKLPQTGKDKLSLIPPDLLFKSPRDFCTRSYLSLRARLRRTTKQSHNTLIITEIATPAPGGLAMTESEFFKGLEAGYRVRTLSLDPAPVGIWPGGVEIKIGDVTNPADVQSAMPGVDAVVHLAALLHIINPVPEMREKYERINVGGTATVIEAAIKAGVRRVVLFSTIAVYGPSNAEVQD